MNQFKKPMVFGDRWLFRLLFLWIIAAFVMLFYLDDFDSDYHTQLIAIWAFFGLFPMQFCFAEKFDLKKGRFLVEYDELMKGEKNGSASSSLLFVRESLYGCYHDGEQSKGPHPSIRSRNSITNKIEG